MTDQQQQTNNPSQAPRLQPGRSEESIAAGRSAQGYAAGERFLIFTERGLSYALAARRVREALLLPSLTVLEETPPWVVGAFERHGTLVPVISPALALHHQPSPAARASSIGIIAERGDHLLAMHADAVLDLVPAQRLLPIPPDRLGQLQGPTASPPNGGLSTHASAAGCPRPIIEYELALDQQMIPLLETDAVRLHAISADEVSDLPDQRLQAFERELSESDRQRLVGRTLDYSRIRTRSQRQETQPFVVFELAGERFAFAAGESIELARIGSLYPVPGAPAHVLGFSPLRGDVITLVDVRAPLGLDTHGFWEPPMMAVIGFEGHLVAIAIDGSLGLVRANPRPLDELPLKLRSTGSRWLSASIHPGAGEDDADQSATIETIRHPIAVIELADLLTHSGLVVDQVG